CVPQPRSRPVARVARAAVSIGPTTKVPRDRYASPAVAGSALIPVTTRTATTTSTPNHVATDRRWATSTALRRRGRSGRLRSGGREVARGSAVAVMPPESSRARRGTSPSQRIPSYVGGRTRRYAVRGVTTAPTWVRVVRAPHDVVTTPCHRTKGGTRDRNRCPRVAPSGRPPAGSGAPRPADPTGPGARARGRRPPTVGRGPLGACPAHGHRLRRAGRPRRG